MASFVLVIDSQESGDEASDVRRSGRRRRRCSRVALRSHACARAQNSDCRSVLHAREYNQFDACARSLVHDIDRHQSVPRRFFARAPFARSVVSHLLALVRARKRARERALAHLDAHRFAVVVGVVAAASTSTDLDGRKQADAHRCSPLPGATATATSGARRAVALMIRARCCTLARSLRKRKRARANERASRQRSRLGEARICLCAVGMRNDDQNESLGEEAKASANSLNANCALFSIIFCARVQRAAYLLHSSFARSSFSLSPSHMRAAGVCAPFSWRPSRERERTAA